MKTLVILFILVSSSSYAASCKDSLTHLGSPSRNPTDQLISYLNTLLEQRVIGISELETFATGLARSEIINPISEEQAKTKSPALVHRAEIAKHLQKADPAALLEWVTKLLAEAKRASGQRDEVKKDTSVVYEKMTFHPIPAQGSISYAFEMTSTPVTQAQWVAIMGENPSLFKDGLESTTLSINGKMKKLQPDHPVEQLTWYSAAVFANRISERAGLKPFYDFSQVQTAANTKAEHGTLACAGEVLIPEASRATGYRLPTEEEYALLLVAVRETDPKPWRNPSEYSWLPDNSGGHTHAVGQLLPYIVNGFPFYDLYGNVSEWTSTKHGSEYVIYTNSFQRNSNRSIAPRFFRNEGIGFRLARTLK